MIGRFDGVVFSVGRRAAVAHRRRTRNARRQGHGVAALGRGVRGEVGADERVAAGRRRRPEAHERTGEPARAAVGVEVDLAAVNRTQRADGRGLVTRHAGAEQARHRDGGDDADDRHDDQQLDERETLLIANLHCPLLN